MGSLRLQAGPRGAAEGRAQGAAILGLIAALRASGRSLRGISRELASRGILARNGRPFAPMTLARLVTNRPVSDDAQPLEPAHALPRERP